MYILVVSVGPGDGLGRYCSLIGSGSTPLLYLWELESHRQSLEKRLWCDVCWLVKERVLNYGLK